MTARQRRLRRVVVQAHRPFGVCAVAAADERRGFVAGRDLVERGHLDGDAAVVEHLRQGGDGSGRRSRRDADPVADRQGGLVVAGLRPEPGGRALVVSAGPLPEPQRARGGRIRAVEHVPVRHRVGLLAQAAGQRCGESVRGGGRRRRRCAGCGLWW